MVCVHCRGVIAKSPEGTAYCCASAELDALRVFRAEIEGVVKSDMEVRSMLTETVSLRHVLARAQETKARPQA